MPQTLTIAVCMSNGMTLSDFVTPMEILTSLNLADDPMFINHSKLDNIPYRVKVEYLAPELGPHVGYTSSLPSVNATKTYADAIKSGVQYDILWVPAGPLPDVVNGKDRTPIAEIEFLKHQAPGAKYVMSVCVGSLSLATAGLLEGKRATTNKGFFRVIQAITSKNITWIPKARWVVDGNTWTSSGVTAGLDMALAFVEHLAGKQITHVIRGMVEITEKTEGDDPFAEFHGLV